MDRRDEEFETFLRQFHGAAPPPLRDYGGARRAGNSRKAFWVLGAASAALLITLSIAIVRRIPERESAVAAVEAAGGHSTYEPGTRIHSSELVHSDDIQSLVLVLEDGSHVEAATATELLLTRVADGMEVFLRRGSVIVSAAKQRAGRRLYVQTSDIAVSATDTIFLVTATPDGSQAAALEGEVEVRHGVTMKTLHAVERFASSASIRLRGLDEEIAWSRNSAAHGVLLRRAASLEAQEIAPRRDVAPISVAPIATTPVEAASPGPVASVNPSTQGSSGGVTVRGRMSSEDGRPAVRRASAADQAAALLPSALYISLIAPGVPARTALIATDGSFEFRNVRPGAYQATVIGAPTPPAALVVAERDITDFQVLVPPLIEIAGGVAAPGQVPAFQLTFTKNGATPWRARAMSVFNVTLTPGDYRVAVEGLPERYRIQSITAAGVDLRQNDLKVSLNGAPPIAITLIDSAAPSGVRIRGRVTGREGTVAPAADIITLMGPTPNTYVTSIASDGTFELQGVAPGTYPIGLFSSADGRRSLPDDLNPLPVIVRRSDLSDLEIAMPASRKITGHVLVEGGGPAPHLEFSFTSTLLYSLTSGGQRGSNYGMVHRHDSARSIDPQPDGSFVIALGEGVFHVAVDAAPYSVKSFTYGPVDLLSSPAGISAFDSEEFRLTLTRDRIARAPADVYPPVAGDVSGGPGENVSYPKLLDRINVSVPEEARIKGIRGSVLVHAVINRNGTVVPVRVIRGLGTGIDESVIDAVRPLKFSPAMRRNSPIDSAIVIEVTLPPD